MIWLTSQAYRKDGMRHQRNFQTVTILNFFGFSFCGAHTPVYIRMFAIESQPIWIELSSSLIYNSYILLVTVGAHFTNNKIERNCPKVMKKLFENIMRKCLFLCSRLSPCHSYIGIVLPHQFLFKKFCEILITVYCLLNGSVGSIQYRW